MANMFLSATGIYAGAPVTPPTPTPVEVVAWATGTDAQIVAMVQAADAGNLDLTEYWSVGQERNVSLSSITTYPSGLNDTHEAQTIVMVLVAADTGDEDNTNPCYKYQYKTATSGRTYPSFIVHMKGLLNSGKMNSTASNTGSWNSCLRREWCNDYFKPAFESDLLPIVKEVKVKTIDTYNGSIMQQSTGDYFFLPTMKEILGIQGNSNSTEANEFPIWPHYSTASNRTKYISGDTGTWWLRSPNSSRDTEFCLISVSGYNDVINANSFCFLAIACCI